MDLNIDNNINFFEILSKYNINKLDPNKTIKENEIITGDIICIQECVSHEVEFNVIYEKIPEYTTNINKQLNKIKNNNIEILNIMNIFGIQEYILIY